MKLGIMQPYFFPYIGYFELIHNTDKWIVFDVVQYKSRSWMNRNRILHPNEGWQYFGVPVKKTSRDTLIKDIEIKDKNAALGRILGQINHYKNKAPNYSLVVDIIKQVFAETKSNNLVDLNISSLKVVCSYLGIAFNWEKCSEMNFDFSNVTHPRQWALEICTQLGANEYLNPLGGKAIFVPDEFEERGINLIFQDQIDFEYDCHPFFFEENLSIIDVMMWNHINNIYSSFRKTDAD
jgi:hypothetical protein